MDSDEDLDGSLSSAPSAPAGSGCSMAKRAKSVSQALSNQDHSRRPENCSTTSNPLKPPGTTSSPTRSNPGPAKSSCPRKGGKFTHGSQFSDAKEFIAHVKATSGSTDRARRRAIVPDSAVAKLGLATSPTVLKRIFEVYQQVGHGRCMVVFVSCGVHTAALFLARRWCRVFVSVCHLLVHARLCAFVPASLCVCVCVCVWGGRRLVPGVV